MHYDDPTIPNHDIMIASYKNKLSPRLWEDSEIKRFYSCNEDTKTYHQTRSTALLRCLCQIPDFFYFCKHWSCLPPPKVKLRLPNQHLKKPPKKQLHEQKPIQHSPLPILRKGNIWSSSSRLPNVKPSESTYDQTLRSWHRTDISSNWRKKIWESI